MSTQILNNRLKKEIMVLDRDPPPGVSCYPKEDNLTKLEAYIKGPPDTPYERGLFKLDIQIPNNYPFDPPQIRFVTRIYHPNIDDAGRICADILKKGDKGSWKPALNLRTTLLLLTQLLANPNPDDPLDAEIAREYQIDRPTFNQKALEFTLKYANEETVMSSSHDQEEKEVKDVVKIEEKNDETEETIIKTKPKLSLSLSKKKNTPNSSQSTSSQSSESTHSSFTKININENLLSSKRKDPKQSNLVKKLTPEVPETFIKKPKISKEKEIKKLETERPSVDFAKKESESIDDLNEKINKKSLKKESHADVTKDIPKPINEKLNPESIIESKHFAKAIPVSKQKSVKEVQVNVLKQTLNSNAQQQQQQQNQKRPLNEVIILSDDEDDGVLHSFQLSKKLKRTKLSLSRQRK